MVRVPGQPEGMRGYKILVVNYGKQFSGIKACKFLIDIFGCGGMITPSWQNPWPGLEAGISKGVQAPLFRTALFLCPYDSPGGLCVGAFELAGVLWAGLPTTCSPPFFVLKRKRRIF